jgi:DNA-binding transcriptional MerR regulator
MGTLSIGQLAPKTKINSESIRYYERRGLLPEPPRNKSGHRQNSDQGFLFDNYFAGSLWFDRVC